MKKIWQKSLACMVSAALCLTAFVGCLTVNAATTYNGKITSDGVAVETTATEATVKLTISADVDMAAAGITVSTDFGALTNVSVPTENEVRYKIDPPADGGFNLANGTVIVEAKDQKDYPFNNAEVTLTFTKKDGLTLNDGDSFAVNVTPLKNSTIPAATYNEDEIYFTVDVINITVKASTPVCEHANATYDYSVVDGNCITKLVCPDCDNVETVATVANHSIYKSPVLNAGLAIAFRIEKADFENDYSDIRMVCEKDLYDGNNMTGVDTLSLTPTVDPNYKTRYTFLYTALTAKDMCSSITMNMYGTDSNGKVVLLSNSVYSLVTYIEKYYNAYKTSGTAVGIAMKNLMADMAAYGSYAQDYYSYHTDRKPNDNIDTVNALPTTFNTDGIANTGFNIYKSPLIANDISVTLRINKTDVDAYGDDICFEIEYVDYKNVKQDNIVIDFNDFTYNDTLGRYEFEFNKMTAASAYLQFNAKVVQKSTGKDLATACYSLEKYAANQYTSKPDAVLTHLAQSMINYSKSAQTYFIAANS